MKITARKYAQALAALLDTGDTTIIANFLHLLRKRNQMKMLPKILKSFEEEWLSQRGYTKIGISYPGKFEAQIKELEQHLHTKFGDKLSLKLCPSKTMLGGFKLKIDDTLLDATVEAQLRSLRKKLTTS